MKRTHGIAVGLIAIITALTGVAAADDVHVTVNVNGQTQAATQTAMPAPAPRNDEWRASVSTAASYVFGQAAGTAEFANTAGLDPQIVQEAFAFRNDAHRFYRSVDNGASLSVLATDHAELQNHGRNFISRFTVATRGRQIAMGDRIDAMQEELAALALVMRSAGARYEVQPRPAAPPVIVVSAPNPPAYGVRPPPPRPRPAYVQTQQASFRPRVIVRAPRARAAQVIRTGTRHSHTVSWQF
jgi:hypothetical protein